MLLFFYFSLINGNILRFAKAESTETPKSIYGHPGVDTVVTDEIDGFELLEILEKPTNIKHIREANYVSTPILDSDYPTVSKNANSSRISDIKTEGDKIYTNFCNIINMTQDKLYYHPAGNAQFGGDDELIAKADRIKARLILHPTYPERHATGLYVPPGELITIDIPQFAVNKLTASINIQSYDSPNVNKRLPKLRCGFSLTKAHSTFGWPYGGQMVITFNGGHYGSFSHGIEMNVSGCIKQGKHCSSDCCT